LGVEKLAERLDAIGDALRVGKTIAPESAMAGSSIATVSFDGADRFSD
jgi:hypothetical protein